MQHQPPRLPEGLDQQARRDVCDNDYWNDPTKNHAKQPWEDRVRIARDVEEIKVAINQSLSAHDPETHGRQAEHNGVMHGDAKRQRNDVK